MRKRRHTGISAGGSKRSVYLRGLTNELAVQVAEAEGYPNFSAFVEECIVQHCGNLGYKIEPAKVVKVG